MKKRIEKARAEVVLYYVKCSIGTMKDRVVGRNNNFTKDSFKISEKMFDGYVRYWESPSEDENYILVE